MSQEQRYRVRYGPVYVPVDMPEPGRHRTSWQVAHGAILPLGVDPAHLQHLISTGIVEPVEHEEAAAP